jgi:hypothetical protein
VLGTFDQIVKLILSIDPTVAFEVFADTFDGWPMSLDQRGGFPKQAKIDFLYPPKHNLVCAVAARTLWHGLARHQADHPVDRTAGIQGVRIFLLGDQIGHPKIGIVTSIGFEAASATMASFS